jgi:hypothetical protein
MRRRYFPILFSSGGRTETLTYQPDSATGQDTYIDSGGADTGHADEQIIRITNSGRASLIKFPIDLAGGVVQSGVLTLWNETVVAANITITARRILAANDGWNEASTWNYKTPSTVRWAGDAASDGGADAGCSQSGTDFSATALGTVLYTSNAAQATQLDMTLDPVELALMCANNYGFVLRGSVANTLNLRSCEVVVPATRPRLVLVVHYA